jgi:hypothetical protein
MSSPLHTILKIKQFSNLTNKNPIYINQFENKDIKNLPKRDRYYGVFMKITGYFEKSKFYREVFLPRMDERKAFMRMNRKFTQLTQEEFEEQKKKLQINNTYDEYSSRQDIPLFTYITNDPDQFENWSAIRIFEWWRNLRMSRIPKRKWPILDSVKYLFINQFMRIMNSYLKYGVDKSDKLAFDELKKYLKLVDEFYTSGGQYQHLLDAHLAFCEWFSARFIGGLLFESGRNNDKGYVSSSIYYNRKDSGSIFTIEQSVIIINEFFNKTLQDNNFILVIPQSFFQKESKFINTYTAPLIVFLGVNYRTHTNISRFQDNYSPFNQIIHDLIHSKSCKSSYEQLYPRTNFDDIILFEQRCKFLTIVSSIDNDNCKKLLWLILHEISFFEKGITEIAIGTTIESSNFFDFNILFEKLNNLEIQSLLKKYLTFEPENSEILKLDSIYTLICACIVYFMSNFLPLEYFQYLKIEIESIVFMNNPKNISNKVIKISNRKNQLIEFQYDIKTKQLKPLSISDYNLLKGIYELQSKGISFINNPDCFVFISYLLSPNTIQVGKLLSGCAFFNDVFLPKMRERIAKKREIMRLNKKFSKLLEDDFLKKNSELGMTTNSFNKYQERYDTPLFTYIYEDKDQFENWSAIRIFEWWSNLRMSGTQFSTITQKISKREWPVFDAVKYLFINQILHILNSYRKYGITDERHLAYRELQNYLLLVDVFYTKGGQYQYLLNAHLAYCRWFNVRFIKELLFETGIKNTYSNTSTYILSKNDSLIESILKLFNYTLEDTNSILFAPSSYFQKESKFINTYSAPLIVFLGVNYRTHIDSPNFKSLYSPERQMYHDITVHYSNMLIKSSYNNIQIKSYNDFKLFAKRCKFLMIVSLINNENLSILLWYILHERSKTYFIDKFFNIEKLLEKLLNRRVVSNSISNDAINNSLKQILINGINKLIYVCIIFFICQDLLLNEIKQIEINIITDNFNNDTIKIVFNEEMIIEFQINIDNKEINITNIIPNIDRRYIEGLNYIKKDFYIIIPNPIQSKINNYEKTKKSIKNILKAVESIQYLKQLQQVQPN